METRDRHHFSSRPVGAPPRPVRQRSDSRPWYRQFWPWFLIALPASSVVFSFVTFYVAMQNADEVLPHEGDSTSWSAPRESPAPAPPVPAVGDRADSDAAETTSP